MALVTLQVLEGLERGRVFENVMTPVTIGREDDNVIRLNDERVSRFHAKIQEDDGSLILTDLESTNGTRVNGYLIQMRVLRVGDKLAIGRCLLLYGSQEEIEAKRRELARQRRAEASPKQETVPSVAEEVEAAPTSEGLTLDGRFAETKQPLFEGGPPEMVKGLSPLQRAQLADLFAYFHEQLGQMADSAIEEPNPNGFGQVYVQWSEWQRLLKLEMDVAVYLRKINEPGS